MAYTGASYDDPGAYFDSDVAAHANDPYSQYKVSPDQLAAQRQAFIASQTPEARTAQASRNQETNAYQIARDAALGMMNPGSMGANGVDYGKAQADPSAALNSFLSSGYTGQQALADGWATGVGTPGWQSTPQLQRLNPNGGNVAAMNPQDPNWGRQATTGQIYGAPAATGQSSSPYGGQMFGPGAGRSQGIYGQLGQQLQSRAAPRSPYGSFGGGAPQAGNPYAALISSGQQGGGQSQAPQAPRPQQPVSGGGYGGIYGQLQSQLAQRGGR